MGILYVQIKTQRILLGFYCCVVFALTVTEVIQENGVTMFADHLALLVTRQEFGGTIERSNTAIRVHRKHPHAQFAEHSPELFIIDELFFF
jgi:hypothetical protein